MEDPSQSLETDKTLISTELLVPDAFQMHL